MEKIKDRIIAFRIASLNWIRQINKDRDAFIFIGFLLVASFFWLLNALRKEYVSELECPIRYVNFPDSKLVAHEPQNSLRVIVQGGGFTLLRYLIGNEFEPIIIDVAQMKSIKTKHRRGVFMLSRDKKDNIISEMSKDLDLISIVPDTLFLSLEDKVVKKVPVSLDVKASFEKQYLLAGPISFNPDSINISGPENIIDTILNVYTKNAQYFDLKDTLVRNITIESISGVEYDKKRGVVTIPVEPYTESVLQIPIKVINLPDSLRIKTFPATVRVSFVVGLSKYEFVNDKRFSVVVDYNELNAFEINNKLKIRMEDIPSEISNVDYSPIFVDFLLEKKSKR